MDNFKLKIMSGNLENPHFKLTKEIADTYSTYLLTTDITLLHKKLFYKIAKGGFHRGSQTVAFMEKMLHPPW